MNTVASLADILLQRKIYEDKEELMMVNHVYPEFVSQHRYLRACACCVVAKVKFKNVSNLKR